jgi:large exoprotein involved in heme utilization and adhesion
VSVTSAGNLTLQNTALAATAAGGSVNSTPANIVLSAGGPIAMTGGSINADTAGTAPGGAIQLLTAGAVTMAGAAAISSNTSGAGKGGDIDFGSAASPIASLAVSGGSTIAVNATGSGATAGAGGAINIYSAGPVTLSDAGTKLSSDSSNNAVGGAVTIIASSLSMDSGAQVTANTSSNDLASSPGRTQSTAARLKAPASPTPIVTTGGSVRVQTTGDVALTGPGTTISANATGAGRGGTVTITSAGLSLTNGAIIATTATGTGNSGDILITLTPNTAASGGPPPIVLSGNSKITTDAKESTGGNITLDAGGSPLSLNHSSIDATAGATGNGGNITISGLGRTILQSGGILAQADSGNGGAINIFLDKGALFVEDAESLVSAQSASGNDGTVTINSPQTNFNAALATPDVSVTKTPELTSNACRRDKNRSTFVREGHGGIPPGPDGYQTAAPSNPASKAPTAALSPAARSGSKDAGTLVAAIAPAGCE